MVVPTRDERKTLQFVNYIYKANIFSRELDGFLLYRDAAVN